jgi:hypothetical protein
MMTEMLLHLRCWGCETVKDYTAKFASAPPELTTLCTNPTDAQRYVMLYLSVWTDLGWALVPPCPGPVCDQCGERQTITLHTREGGETRLWNGPQWFCPQCIELIKEAVGSDTLPEPEEAQVIVAMQSADAPDAL